MDENKDKTVKFDPVTEEIIRKEEVRRTNDDLYSERRNSNFSEDESESTNKLLYVAIILAVIIVIMLVAGLFMLGRSMTRENPQEETEIEKIEEELPEKIDEEEPEEKEEEEIIIKSDIVFYGDSIIKKDSGYSVLADVYDENFKKTDHRKIFIDKSTKIYEDGKRMSAEGFIYVIESLAGESIVVQSEIRDKDGYAIMLKYESGFEESIQEEEEKEESEDILETETEQEPQDTENPPADDETSEGSEGIVVE